LSGFYSGLLAAEARHFEQYLELAERYRGDLSAAGLAGRIDEFRRLESRLVTAPDTELRFHSGPPAGVPAEAQRGKTSRR
jgi:tRNA-(ms[2]io[6]A)-hydroxylase